MPRFTLEIVDGSAAHDGCVSDDLAAEASQRPASAPNEDSSAAYRIQVHFLCANMSHPRCAWEQACCAAVSAVDTARAAAERI